MNVNNRRSSAVTVRAISPASAIVHQELWQKLRVEEHRGGGARIGRASEKVGSRAQGAGEQRQLGGGQGGHVVGKPALGDADQAVAANSAWMFQSLFRPYRDLRFESVTTCEHRSADDRRETGVNEGMAADHDHHPLFLGVSSSGTAQQIHISALHRSSQRWSRDW